MKLIMAILNRDDEKAVSQELMKGGYYVTKLAGTGGFLKARSSTIISAVNNERLEGALEIIKNTSKSRKYDISKVDSAVRPYAQMFTDHDLIVAGGATVFVLNIENFYKY